LAAALAASAAPPPTARSSPEPTKEALEAVHPEWEARGWKAVVPHAYVLKKLLPALEKPEVGAAPVFWLKGGTRVPVLVQGQEWWKISWTEGRAGWVRVQDVEPHASFILIDTQTGKVQKRLAAKGQYGAVSDGKFLWSIANTGITRTLLDERPVFWSRGVAGDRNARFPETSLWTPDRSHFYVRSREGDSGPLFRADVVTGAVEAAGTPPRGSLAGLTPEGRLVLLDTSHELSQALLFDPATSRTLRKVPAEGGMVSPAGLPYLWKGRELIRCSADLKPVQRLRLPAPVDSACLSADGNYAAVCYARGPYRNGESPYDVRIYEAKTLRPVINLKLPETYAPYLSRMGASPQGWWVAGSGEMIGEVLFRFTRTGKYLEMVDGVSPTTSSADGKQVYFTDFKDEEERIVGVDPATGRRRVIALSWRRKLPAEYLPNPEGGTIRSEISSLTLSPDGRTLIVTEWLSGDLEA
jgi:hypothetical protein